MNELMTFDFEGSAVRNLIIDDAPWWVGKDVASILGYKDTVNALKAHVDDEDKQGWRITTSVRDQDVTIINESGLYSLILRSKLDSAKTFKRWVTSEVLPQIRRSGSYGHHERSLETKESIRIIKELKPLARLRPQYYIDAVQQVLKQTGIPVTPTVHHDHVPHTSVVYESPIDEFIASYGSIVGQPSGEIYSAYKEYCLKRNAPVESHIEFSKQVKLNHGLKTGFKKIKGKTCRVYVLE